MFMSTMHWHHVLVPHVELLSFERCRGICARVCRWQEEHRLSASGQGGAVPVHTPQHHQGPRAGITTSKQGSQTSLSQPSHSREAHHHPLETSTSNIHHALYAPTCPYMSQYAPVTLVFISHQAFTLELSCCASSALIVRQANASWLSD